MLNSSKNHRQPGTPCVPTKRHRKPLHVIGKRIISSRDTPARRHRKVPLRRNTASVTANPGTPPGRQCFRQYARNKTLRHRTRRNIPEASPLRTPRADAAARPAFSSLPFPDVPSRIERCDTLPCQTMRPRHALPKQKRAPRRTAVGLHFCRRSGLRPEKDSGGENVLPGQARHAASRLRLPLCPFPCRAARLRQALSAAVCRTLLPKGTGSQKLRNASPVFRTERLLRQRLQNREFSCSKAFW